MPRNPASLIEPVVQIADRAGAEILKIYETGFEVETKEDHSPLTAADRASHALICRELRALTPEVPVWSEESAAIDFAERSTWDEFWLVDPLDGTKEFIKRNGEFTVNIALIRNHEPVLGVVYAPVRDTCYFGLSGSGAFVREADGGTRPIHVTGRAARPLRVVGSRSHRGGSLDALLAKIGEHEMLPMGSSLKLCLVAAGAADLYPRLGPTSEWDTAAAHAVVEAAGGRVVDLEGRPLRYNEKVDVLNPYFLVFGDKNVDWTRFFSPAKAP